MPAVLGMYMELQRRRRWMGRNLCAAGALLGATAIAPASWAQVTWSHTQVSTANGSMPSIAVDRLGYVHVGWVLNQGGSSWYAYHLENQSGLFQQTLVDSKSTSTQAIFPFLSTDSLGFYHLVWRDLQKSETVFYRSNNPLTRSLVKKSFSGGHTHDPILDITADDVAHVMTEADSCSGCSGGSNLYDEGYTATTDRAGPVISLPRDPNDATGVQQFSSAVTADGTRHLVFSMRLAPPADNQRLIYYSSRAPDSSSWSTPVSITGHDENYQGWPALVADSSGALHVVYSSGDYGIYYVNNSGASWSSPLRINDQNEVMDAIPSVAIDPNGRLHVVFQRYTPGSGGTRVSVHYTTNAYDPDNWLDPASEVLQEVGDDFQLTHQNRKIAVSWVDNQVLIPYQTDSAIWLASTSDVPVTPPDAGGTSELTSSAGFVPPEQLARTVSNTSETATAILKLDLEDAGGDGQATRVSQLHVHVGENQSRVQLATKQEGLSYLLAGAELLTDSGERIPGVVSDFKLVFRGSEGNLWVPDGATRSYTLRVWAQNQPHVTGKSIELRIKPDQDVVVESGGSAMRTDQAVVYSDVALLVDTASDCAPGSACSDGDPCTWGDTCNAQGECTGTAISCESDECNTRSCNGSAECSVVAQPCAGPDECALGTDDCSPDATCSNTADAFTCSCKPGYQGDGLSCADIDECQLPQSVCDHNATCANSPGSFACTCQAGHVDPGDGSCEPVSAEPEPPATGSDPVVPPEPPPGTAGSGNLAGAGGAPAQSPGGDTGAATGGTGSSTGRGGSSDGSISGSAGSSSAEPASAPSASGCSVARTAPASAAGSAATVLAGAAWALFLALRRLGRAPARALARRREPRRRLR